MSDKTMTLSEAASLYLRQRQQRQDQPQRPLRRPVTPAPVTPPAPSAAGVQRQELMPVAGSPSARYQRAPEPHGGDEQWPRFCETVHHAGMIHGRGFRPLNLASVDVTKPSQVGLAYLDLGPFFTRHLSNLAARSR